MKFNRCFWPSRRALAASLVFCAPAAAHAQTAPTTPIGGAPAGMAKSASPLAIASPVQPSASFVNAQYATAGVALRNRRAGFLQIAGVTPPVKSALLYWAYLFDSASPPPATQAVTFCNLNSTAGPVCRSVTGAKIGVGPDVCWGSSGIAVYRSNVTPYVAASGNYSVALGAAQSAAATNADPWSARPVFPAAEGASLVVVGTGARKVGVYDVGLAGQSFRGAVSYSLALPGGVTSTPAQWDSIVADGQTGAGRIPGLSTETTFINNVAIAGAGASLTLGVENSDFDGGVGSPLPQLWDTTGHALSASIAPLGAATLPIRVASGGTYVDCLSPIANVTSY